MIRRIVILLFIAVAANAQVPTPDEFLGYKLGERFTPYARILDYFNELARKSSLITVHQFGETYEHRPLVLAVITAARNRTALDTLRANIVSLADPATTAARASEIAKSTPAVAWLAYGVHGNESSSAEASMLTASTLLRDPDAAKILDNLIVVIDPLLNPDGRERYVQWYIRTRGAQADPNPDSFEHVEPWPGGRFNHYLIDMNRDWSWTSQQETKARVAEYRRWNPQVFVDFHEMSSNSTYFFPPDAKPLNANLPKDVEKWLEVFGRANAAAFTAKGWPFFVGETFDLFYPGYGDSWPALHGAIGMTYEMAGGPRGGSSFLRDDQTVLTLGDRIQRHYTTSMSTLRTAAAHAEELLLYSYSAMRTPTSGGQTTFFIPPASPNFRPLIEVLQRQTIQIGMLTSPVTVKGSRVDNDASESQTFPAGTAVISTRQPLGGLVQTLLERTPTFTKGFVEAQRQKTEADEPNDFYDLTSWSLPLAMDVEAFVVNSPISAEVRPYEKSAAPAFRSAAYGYIIDGNDPNIYRAAGQMLADGVRFNVSEDPVTVGDRSFSRGTLIVLKGGNKPDVDASLGRIARDLNLSIFPLESGWMGGTAFGSERIHFIKDPKVALVGGAGVAPTSYGMLWHTLDIDTPIPHSNLFIDSLRNTDLSKYNVLILPDGTGYSDHLGKNGISKLQSWLRNGGTIVAIKGASTFLRDKDVEISKLKPWEPPKKKDDDKTPAEERYNDYRIPGATFRTTMNDRSYLTFGVTRPPYVLIEGAREEALLPVAHRVDNIVTIVKDNPLVSGVAWPESIDRMKGSVYMVSEPYGRGQVITFADEPHFRLFWRGTLPLFMNAILYSPSFPRE
ncbi:MAG TPA: M14 family metallopeptidase [Thermoanaerobaculia bacterium]|nr:M14 family metallopeptidase [Thermoanaerobaculia bacterium]